MSISKGKNQQHIKEQNRALILKLICTGSCTSRADLSRKTGLTKMTITNITNELITSNLIKEGNLAKSSSVGRKAIYLLPNVEDVFCVGVHISRDYVGASLLTLNAKIKSEYTINIEENENAKTLMIKILQGINHVSASTHKENILGIGIACIGPVDTKNGAILSPPDFHNIKNMHLKSIIEEKTGITVTMNNDMNASAIAERLFGNGKAISNFVYLGITHGIGAGIVLNGELFEGEKGFGGEIGHTTINFDGPICSCGNKGCLEVYASIPILLKKANEHFNDKLNFSQVIHLAKNGDLFCENLINEMCFHIGIALINSINILDCNTIFIGQDGSLGGEYFVNKIKESIEKDNLFKKYIEIKVALSAFLEKSAIIGSGVLVLQKLFSANG